VRLILGDLILGDLDLVVGSTSWWARPRGGLDLVVGSGEVVEFDTQVDHWFGSADDKPAEVLSLFGRQGERMHVRATNTSSDRTARS